MPPADLLQAIRKKPFVPFRMYVSDSAKYEVRHPELVMVGLGSAVVGIPAPDQTQPIYDHYETVDMRHITRLEPLPALSSGPDDGQQGA